MAEDNGGSKFVYFLAGVGFGALLGILFAPQSGEETRRMIAEKAEESKDYLLQKGREVKQQTSEYIDRGKEAVSRQKEHLAAAIEAGKQAYRAESESKSL